ncbi:MAG: biopolymer transporter ExbD [Calditrichaeota bacterium]|nr:biopolymer transporter ExbD [Calditrichota bacterium]
MKLLNKKPAKAILNITPLIDVLFILIIFFVVSSTFLEQPGIKLELPKAQSGDTQRVERAVLYISAASELFLNDDPATLENLSGKLSAMMQNRAEKSLIISADKGVQHGLVVQVMDIARSSSVQKLVISTERKE